MDAVGVQTRQLPPAQIKAFAASCGTRAKTGRIDAELIACFMAFRPESARQLPLEKLRLLRAFASKRGQLVETRKRLLAPIAHHSGTLRGKRAIGGGRRLLRHVMFQAALVASHHNPVLKLFADRLRKAGKPHKVIVTVVARKLVTIANALCKSRQSWAAQSS